VEIAAIVIRPLVAVLLLLWLTSVVPRLAAIAVAAAVCCFAAPIAMASWPVGTWQGADLQRVVGVELVRGVSLGLAAAAPLWAAATAGRWAGASWRGGGGVPISSLYLAMVGVAFIAVDGPVLVCAAISRSYATAAVGAPLLDGGWKLAAMVGWWSTAVRLALPIALTFAVAELAAAAAARVAAAVAVAWPTSALAPAVVLLVTAPMVPLLLAAFADAVRRGLAS
jgi:type III secretory pathway component EscT